jgi:predicted dehydrogenase
VHVADLLRAVVPDEVASVGATVVCDADPDAVDLDAHVVVRFAGGAAGSFHASWISCPGPDHQLTVVGTEGTLHLDSRTPLTVFRGDGARGEKVPLPATTTNPFEQLLRAIAGETPAITAADGRASLAIVAAAYEAAREGRFVDVDRGAA